MGTYGCRHLDYTNSSLGSSSNSSWVTVHPPKQNAPTPNPAPKPAYDPKTRYPNPNIWMNIWARDPERAIPGYLKKRKQLKEKERVAKEEACKNAGKKKIAGSGGSRRYHYRLEDAERALSAQLHRGEIQRTRCAYVFVGNIPASTTRKQLAHLFRGCGKVRDVDIRCSRGCALLDGGAPATLYASVEFVEKKSILRALKFDGAHFSGSTLKVCLSPADLPDVKAIVDEKKAAMAPRYRPYFPANGGRPLVAARTEKYIPYVKPRGFLAALKHIKFLGLSLPIPNFGHL